MNNKDHGKIFSFLLLVCFLHHLPLLASGKCTCDPESETSDQSKLLKYKLVAISSILGAGALGFSLPIFVKKIKYFQPEHKVFFLIRGFIAGLILATGFVHVLTDAFQNLASPCLEQSAWSKFPFTGFLAMLSAMITMMIESFATNYYRRLNLNKALPVSGDEEMKAEHGGHMHVETHGHAHRPAVASDGSAPSDIFRHRVISQVLELGILVHSVMIGFSIGTSKSTKTVKPLVAAMSFHQLFEGMGLGGCISQAKFKPRAVAVMLLFFCFTTPTGIAIGMGISKFYNASSPTALIVGGVFNAGSAGILIYMALVDLLAQDFANPKLQANVMLQLGVDLSVLLGAGSMAVLATWN